MKLSADALECCLLPQKLFFARKIDISTFKYVHVLFDLRLDNFFPLFSDFVASIR